MADTPSNKSIDLEPVAPPGVPVVRPPGAAEWRTMTMQAAVIARTSMVPGRYRNRPDDVLVAMLHGRELGIGPMQALQSIYVIDGKPTLTAATTLALILRAGHEVWPIEKTATRASAGWKRRDTGREGKLTVTIDDIPQQLRGQVNWRQWPRHMLWARLVTELGRTVFPDVLMGQVYTPDEIDPDVPVRVDPDTGEVAPEMGVLFGDDDPVADEQTVRGLYERIDRLDQNARRALREAMRQAGLALAVRHRDGTMTVRLRASDVPLVESMITQVEADTPADAEIVSGDPTPGDQGEPPPDNASSSPGADPAGGSPDPEGRQHRALMVSLSSAGLNDDDTRHALVGLVTGGRTISSRDLTPAEVDTLIQVAGAIMHGTAMWSDGELLYGYEGEPPPKVQALIDAQAKMGGGR